MGFADVTANCAYCLQPFRLRDRSQLGALNRDRNVYCSDRCRGKHYYQRLAEDVSLLQEYGPCPTCGEKFQSRRPKQFCSLDCYVQSEALLTRLQAENAKQRIWNTCPQCGNTVQKRKVKFCNKDCRHRFYAERFDRWIASPERLALPQNYDEFLSSAVLPCLIEGCSWEGAHLSSHCNRVHGITADQLRELGGFGRTTGLVTADLSALRSSIAKQLIADGKLPTTTFPLERCSPPSDRTPRAETLERAKKARVVMLAERVQFPPPPVPCRNCNKPVAQPALGRQLYCNPKCRKAYYDKQGWEEMRCSYCNELFLGNRTKALRAKRGQKVTCSADCRNKMNMAHCLAVRNKRASDG